MAEFFDIDVAALLPQKTKKIPDQLSLAGNPVIVALASFSANTPVALRPPAARLDDRRQSGRRRITARDRAQIVALYEQGKSTRYVADEVGVSKATVLTVLKRANVPMRPVGAHY